MNDTSMEYLQPAPPVSCPGEETDAALLCQIAAGNMDAWAAFVQRYTALVYSISLRILRHPHDSEDAVQEIFLRIRRYAKSFRYGERAGGWVGTIACRTAMKLAIKKSKGVQMNVPIEEMEVVLVDDHDNPSTDMQNTDDQTTMLRAVDNLPNRLRRPIVMYFLGGMTQANIATDLACDRRTVIDRIQHGLRMLRKELQQIGVAPAAALPLALRDALIIKTPPHLIERLIHLPAVATQTARPTPTPSRTIPWKIVAGLSIATVVGITVILNQNKSQQITSSAPRPVSLAAPLHVAYNFANGIPEGFEVVYQTGNWRINMTPTGRGIEVANKNRLGLLMPVRLPRAPVMITAYGRIATNKKGMIKFALTTDSVTVPHKTWQHDAPVGQSRKTRFKSTTYFWDKFGVQEISGNINAIRLHESTYPGDRLLIILNNVVLERVEIEQISPNRIPPAIRDTVKNISSFNNQPLKIPSSPLRQLVKTL